MVLCLSYAKKKESNVVSASADVVDDFAVQQIINVQHFYLMSPLTLDGLYVSSFQDIYSRYHIGVQVPSSLVHESKVMCPLSWLYDVSSYDPVMIGFFVPFSNADYMPQFSIYSIYDDGYDEITFTQVVSSGGAFYYTKFELDVGSNYLVMHTPAVIPNVINGYNFQLTNVSVFPYPSYSNSYAYTEEELDEIYQKELHEAYLEGLQATDVYDTAYQDGYNTALENVSSSLVGIFERADFNVWVSTVTQSGVTSQGFEIIRFRGMRFYERYTLDLYNSTLSAFQEVGLDSSIGSYGSNSIEFIAYNFGTVIPSYLTLTLDFGVDVSQTQIVRDIACKFTDSNSFTYQGVLTKRATGVYDINFDFSSLLPGAVLEEFSFSSTISLLGATTPYLSDNGTDYGVGFELGFDEGYYAALQRYEQELNEKYQQGYNNGVDVGFNQGYNEGADDAHEFTFNRLITSVIDVPIHTFTSLFNFELLGVNLANFFFALLTVCIVLAVIKLIL